VTEQTDLQKEATTVFTIVMEDFHKKNKSRSQGLQYRTKPQTQITGLAV
jgi:hypothetical protein